MGTAGSPPGTRRDAERSPRFLPVQESGGVRPRGETSELVFAGFAGRVQGRPLSASARCRGGPAAAPPPPVSARPPPAPPAPPPSPRPASLPAKRSSARRTDGPSSTEGEPEAAGGGDSTDPRICGFPPRLPFSNPGRACPHGLLVRGAWRSSPSRGRRFRPPPEAQSPRARPCAPTLGSTAVDSSRPPGTLLWHPGVCFVPAP